MILRQYAKVPVMRKFIQLLGILLLVISFTTNANSQPKPQTFETEKTKIKIERIAVDLENPWGMAMLPNGTILVTERAGTIKLINPKTNKKQEVRGAPKVWVSGQGGLLDIATDPDFAKNKTVYLTFSDPAFLSGAGTAIASATFKATPTPRLTNLKTIFSMAIKTRSGVHFGSRIVFDLEGNIFMTTGDRGDDKRAQDPFDAAGKVLRIKKDGSIPSDNPFADGKKGLPQIWSIGHRNPQGATLEKDTGQLWTLAHGAKGGDEINTPKAGKNYGWPVISYGTQYSGAKIGQGTSANGLEQPVYFWNPSIAPSGLDFYSGDLVPEWKGNLFAGALKNQLLTRLEIKDGKVVHEEQILEDEYGRVRDVRSFPDGALWLLTDHSDGVLLRITSGN